MTSFVFRFRRLVAAVLLVLTVPWAVAAGRLERLTWEVDGVTREALVALPDKPAPGGVPVVFGFHGHGGSMEQAARSFPLHAFWPEAIVVYPQGLPTPIELLDPEGIRAGWQTAAGGQGDRDLRFFDVLLADLPRRHPADLRRVYATGHSNGGVFTYLLWAERRKAFAAFAPSAAVLGRDARKFRPAPALIIASPDDMLVRFEWQQRLIDRVLKLNGCGPFKPDAAGYTVYPSSKGAETALYLHDGGHRFPAAATELIVAFFKAHARE